MSWHEQSAPDPEFPSGEWIGFYQELGSKHRQEMYLTFRGGRVSGAGSDDIGRFTIRGGYDGETREAWWTKSYLSPLGAHTVSYKGYREVKGIWGLWEIPPQARDGFHIWPRAAGGTADVRTARQQQPESIRVAAPAAAPVPCGGV